MSTLKHTIRHQQAQLHSLENHLLRGPRPLQDFSDDMTSSTSPPPSSYMPSASTTSKMKKRSSYDILHGIAGPDSSLPLPKRDGLEENGIREGIPMTFGVGPVSPSTYKRASSPTRTLSRKFSSPSISLLLIALFSSGIPVASVGWYYSLLRHSHPLFASNCSCSL